ncbi:hypothetical protein RYZ83_26145, partial [Klebsiella quasipneumoniae]|nr:hypothetical protein [Klebsiella quasipneumoniae]
KACVLPENPASYRVVRTKSYLFNKANRLLSDTLKFQDEHQQILMACQQNNPQEARAYTVKHILSAGETLRAYIVSR